MYGFYNLLTAIGMILLSPYFFFHGLFSGKYLGQIRERLGWRYPPELLESKPNDLRAGAIWIHAVSVGEVLAVVPLARLLKQRHPERRMVVSTTTTTGQRLARERMQFVNAIFYFPLDWTGPVRRAIHAVKPSVLIIVETEIWPNVLRESRRAGIPVIFVNGRMSARSSRGFHRALSFTGGLLGSFLKRILHDATLFLMQSDEDAARLLALGADPGRVKVTGNLKYDIDDAGATPLSSWLAEELRGGNRYPVIVAGSVLENEEAVVLRAFEEVSRKFPRGLLVLAPRKPDRFDAAGKIIVGSNYKLVRRSAIALNGTGGAALAEPGSVLLLDSLGELASVYCLADAVFVGGSLVPGGGHNILEPACFGKVPVFGPSMENFKEISAKFLEAGAAVQVNSAETLGAAWVGLLTDKERALRMGAIARTQVDRNRGATLRVLAHLDGIISKPGSELGSGD